MRTAVAVICLGAGREHSDPPCVGVVVPTD